MTPPINIDGTNENYSSVTIDGQTVEQITIDGQDVLSTIPDSENLQNQYIASSYNLSNQSTVSTAWTDEQGNSNASPSGDPTFIANAVNGKPSINLDGTDDYFDTGYVHNTNNPTTVYAIVFYQGENQNPESFYAAINTSGGNNRIGLNTTEGSDTTTQTTYADTFAENGTLPAQGYHLWNLKAGSASAELFINGDSEDTFNYTSQGDIGLTTYLGARNFDGSADNFSDGELVEILRYTTKHGTSTRKDVEQYVNDKYSLF